VLVLLCPTIGVYDTLGVAGNPIGQTPNLDRLASPLDALLTENCGPSTSDLRHQSARVVQPGKHVAATVCFRFTPFQNLVGGNLPRYPA